MKKREEYQNRLDEHWQSDYYDWLSDYGTRELKKDAKNRCKTKGHNMIDGTNGKATWYKDDKGARVLRSYYTDVCKIYRGRVYKLWQGYSATTSRHIQAFMNMNGYRGISKREWVMMDIGKGYPLKDFEKHNLKSFEEWFTEWEEWNNE